MSSSELMRYTDPDTRPKRSEMQLAKATRKIVGEVQLAGLKADGQVAFAGHVMEQILALDEYRQQLAEGDPVKNMMLIDIEAHAIRELKRLQTGLFSQWKL